ESSIRLTPACVRIATPEIRLEGKGARVRLRGGDVLVKADGVVQNIADKILFKASGAAVSLSSDAQIDGGRVLLQFPASATDTVTPKSTRPTIIELADGAGNPIARHPYRIVFHDGSELTGTLDENGRAKLDLEQDGEVVFPGLLEVQSA